MSEESGRDTSVLITGGCGYIGSALIPRLLADERVGDVVVLDSLSSGSPANLAGSIRDDLTFRRGDVREYGAVEGAVRGVDAVIHLAAITGAASTHDRKAETFAVNRDGTENVLTAAGKFDVENVVVASSCNNYGRAASTDIDEETEQNPLNPYAESKVACERLLNEAIEAHGFDGTALRMSTNYGWSLGVRFNLVVNHFVFRGLTDRPLDGLRRRIELAPVYPRARRGAGVRRRRALPRRVGRTRVQRRVERRQLPDRGDRGDRS
jgi:Nucleoside-diphosphate-sugar epimerases